MNEIVSPEDYEQIMILDCTAHPGYSLVQGDEGTKAMCTALKDILWFSDFLFPPDEGHNEPVKMTVTSVDTDKGWCAASCHFCVEIKYRGYSQQDILKTIEKLIFSRFVVRVNDKVAESAA
jgi:hypothetical protein